MFFLPGIVENPLIRSNIEAMAFEDELSQKLDQRCKLKLTSGGLAKYAFRNFVQYGKGAHPQYTYKGSKAAESEDELSYDGNESLSNEGVFDFDRVNINPVTGKLQGDDMRRYRQKRPKEVIEAEKEMYDARREMKRQKRLKQEEEKQAKKKLKRINKILD